MSHFKFQKKQKKNRELCQTRHKIDSEATLSKQVWYFWHTKNSKWTRDSRQKKQGPTSCTRHTSLKFKTLLSFPPMYFTSLPPSLFLYLSKSSEDHLCMFFLLILHVFELISLSFCSLSFFFLITRSFNFCLDFWVLSSEFSEFYLKQEQWVLLLFQFSIYLASSSFMFWFGVFFVFVNFFFLLFGCWENTGVELLVLVLIFILEWSFH